MLDQRGALPKFRKTTGQGVGAAVRAAVACAKVWLTRLRRAKLDFGAMDFQSMLMSFVVQQFSEREFQSDQLLGALQKAVDVPTPKCLQTCEERP